MHAAQIIRTAEVRGISMKVVDGRIRVEPVSRVTDDFRANIREHKQKLLALLDAHGVKNATAAPAELTKPQSASTTTEVLSEESTESWQLGPIVTSMAAQCPGVNPGWSPRSWVARLRYLASVCVHNDLARQHAAEADRIEEALASLGCVGVSESTAQDADTGGVQG